MPAPRPRDAATLILVRNDRPEPRILMGRRSGGHDFMPHKWVFPGGRIDRCDYLAPAAAELPADTATALARTARLKRQDGTRLARALALAAVRETFEETGLLLARPAAPRPAPAGWRAFQQCGVSADLSGLSLVARAITPPARHKRFDARFLLADAAGLVSLQPADSRELADVDWFGFDRIATLDLPDITRAVIEVVKAHLAGRASPVLPVWRWHPGRPGAAL